MQASGIRDDKEIDLNSAAVAGTGWGRKLLRLWLRLGAMALAPSDANSRKNRYGPWLELCGAHIMQPEDMRNV